MLQLPPLPTWDAMHPLIIHFPIVLLLLSPLFIIISAALPPLRSGPYMIAAILVLLLGTASLFIAASTGTTAAELVEQGGEMNAVLEFHEHLALETKILFCELSVILAGMYLLPRILRRRETRLFSTLLPLTFLAMYMVGIVFLFNTAHEGGRLVHEFGVHTMIPATADHGTASPAIEDNIAGEGQH